MFSIPIVARSPDGKEHRLLMTKGSLRCTEFDEAPFVVFNHKAMGFYRVMYEETLLLQLMEADFVLEEELCAIVVDSLFFAMSSIPHNRVSANTLVSIVQRAMDTVKSQYLWDMMVRQEKRTHLLSQANFYSFNPCCLFWSTFNRATRMATCWQPCAVPQTLFTKL